MADVAQGCARTHRTDAAPHRFVGGSTRRRAITDGVPTKYMRLVSPCQPSLMTVTSILMMSPSFSTFPSLGIPWQMTLLTEVHTVFGKPR